MIDLRIFIVVISERIDNGQNTPPSRQGGRLPWFYAKIRRQDERENILSASERNSSLADIDGVDTDVTADKIVKFVRDGRAWRYPEG
jgi:hypothetical protein